MIISEHKGIVLAIVILKNGFSPIAVNKERKKTKKVQRSSSPVKNGEGNPKDVNKTNEHRVSMIPKCPYSPHWLWAIKLEIGSSNYIAQIVENVDSIFFNPQRIGIRDQTRSNGDGSITILTTVFRETSN
uniref:Uncharacterized protein n=1 Tax=Megaselia scalaris TaxID=36166 RepID=T1H2S6_MEGSC